MSGGYFNYQQYQLETIADEIHQLAENNEPNYSYKTIHAFRLAAWLLRTAVVCLHRIDYLLSGDDSERAFHARLEEDLRRVNHDIVS